MLTNEIARRCEQKLGLGQFPMVRRRLYAKLQRLCEQKGEGPLQIVAGVLDEALGPKVRDAGQYFCWVIKRRLEEQGYWPAGETPVNQTRDEARAIRAKQSSIGRPVQDPGLPGPVAELERLRLSNELLKRELDTLRKRAEGGAR